MSDKFIVPIPERLGKEPPLFGPFTSKQFGKVLAGLALAGLMAFGTPVSQTVKMLSAAIFVAVWLMFVLVPVRGLTLDVWSMRKLHYRFSSKQIDLDDQEATFNWARIKNVENGIIELYGDIFAVVLEVKPIDIGLRTTDERLQVFYRYDHFLNSIDFPLQINIRTEPYDTDQALTPYYARLEAAETPVEFKEKIAQFVGHLESFVDTHNVLTKKFYVIVPLNLRDHDPNLFKNHKKELRSIKLRKLYGNRSALQLTLLKDTFAAEKQRHAMTELLNRKTHVITTLSGVDAELSVKELDDDRILVLLYQYFNELGGAPT